jgi:hypothetical protein
VHLPPHRALLDAIFLAQNRILSWFSDLQNVLRRLEVPAVLPTSLPSRELVAQLVQRVHHSFWHTTHAKLTTSSKTRLLPHRVKVDRRSGLYIHVTNKLASYFSLIRVPSHRLAYMRFITSNHRLSIEVLRWARSGADYIPEAWRLCRFCQSDVEDEPHAFMICEELVHARSVFRAEIDIIDLNFDDYWTLMYSWLLYYVVVILLHVWLNIFMAYIQFSLRYLSLSLL